MLIACGGRNTEDEDEDEDADAVESNSRGDADALRRQATKLSLLELLLAHGIAELKAHADGSGDSGALGPIECFVEPTPGEFEECETPDGVEELVETILADSNVSFDNDGGFFNLTITTATRECEIEIGWYYTESDSNTATETL